MSFLLRVLVAAKATSNHHKIPLYALDHFTIQDADLWKKFFMKNWAQYIRGGRAPDKEFKDFRNHVLHVQENYWGGAVKAANEWYAKLVDVLKNGDDDTVAFTAGVLTHYVADPIQPLHTGQRDEEGIIHKSFEWGIVKRFEEILDIINNELGGFPDIEIPDGENWLEELIKREATTSNSFYDILVDNFDVYEAKLDVANGFNDETIRIVAPIVARAIITVARVLEKAFVEADVAPPNTNLTFATLMATLAIPVFWIQRNMHNNAEKEKLAAMYEEYEATGVVVDNLPADDKEVRELHAKEVLKSKDARKAKPKTKVKVKPKAKPKKSPKKEPKKEPRRKEEKLRFYLEYSDDVEDAPEIGKKTAARLYKIGINTVQNLLDADPADAEAKLNVRHIKAADIKRWQQEAILAVRIPKVRGNDVKVMVACGYTDPADIAKQDPAKMLEKITPLVESEEGERLLRGSKKPDLEEVSDWVRWAGKARE